MRPVISGRRTGVGSSRTGPAPTPPGFRMPSTICGRTPIWPQPRSASRWSWKSLAWPATAGHSIPPPPRRSATTSSLATTRRSRRMPRRAARWPATTCGPGPGRAAPAIRHPNGLATRRTRPPAGIRSTMRTPRRSSSSPLMPTNWRASATTATATGFRTAGSGGGSAA